MLKMLFKLTKAGFICKKKTKTFWNTNIKKNDKLKENYK